MWCWGGDEFYGLPPGAHPLSAQPQGSRHAANLVARHSCERAIRPQRWSLRTGVCLSYYAVSCGARLRPGRLQGGWVGQIVLIVT